MRRVWAVALGVTVTAIVALGLRAGSAAAAPTTVNRCRVVKTPVLRMTGQRWQPRTIRTPALRLTGVREQSRTIAVPALKMTGDPNASVLEPAPPRSR